MIPPFPPLDYKTWDQYASRILRECHWDDSDEKKILDIKCLMMDCFNRTLDKECIP